MIARLPSSGIQSLSVLTVLPSPNATLMTVSLNGGAPCPTITERPRISDDASCVARTAAASAAIPASASALSSVRNGPVPTRARGHNIVVKFGVKATTTSRVGQTLFIRCCQGRSAISASVDRKITRASASTRLTNSTTVAARVRSERGHAICRSFGREGSLNQNCASLRRDSRSPSSLGIGISVDSEEKPLLTSMERWSPHRSADTATGDPSSEPLDFDRQ